MKVPMNVWDTAVALRSLFEVDTAEDVWVEGVAYPPTKENLSAGHCHVVAIILNRKFGGQILAGNAYHHGIAMRHYWNVIDGITIDVTRDQFAMNSAFAGIQDATNEELADITVAKVALLWVKLLNF
jgi:hypothetical protein